jgi:hypothetical protein
MILAFALNESMTLEDVQRWKMMVI